MVSHRGFDAWISCEGTRLPEYEVSVDHEAHRVSCWVPSEVGKQFVVFWSDNDGGVDTASYLTLDGFKVGGRFLYGKGTTFRSGVRTGEDTERPFVFSNPEEDAQEGPASTKVDLKQCGMIVLTIRRVRRVCRVPPLQFQKIPDTAGGMRKYFDVRVGYGSATKSRKRQPATWDIVPYDKSQPEMWVEFVFRYRSAEFLEGQGLKPRSEVVLPATGARKLKTSPAANAESESPQSAKTSVSETAGTSSQKRSSKRYREPSSEADPPYKAPKLTPQSSASSQFPTTAIDLDFFKDSDPEYDRSFEAPDEYAWQYSSPDIDKSR